MEQHITPELVEELLAWSRERLEKKDCPKTPIEMGPGRIIPDCTFYISCIMQTLAKQGANPIFAPLVADYNSFKQKVDAMRQENTAG